MSISCPFKPMGGGYEFFDYIENQPSRVGEHIDLEVNINALTFTAEYEVYHIEGNANFVGNWLAGGLEWLACNKGNVEVYYPGVNNSHGGIRRIPTPSNKRIVQSPTYFIINDITWHPTGVQFGGIIPLKVMGSSAQNPGAKQYKYVKIYDGDTLIRDLIPAKRISDGWVGMYCRVGNKFYGGPKADSFLAGTTLNNYKLK